MLGRLCPSFTLKQALLSVISLCSGVMKNLIRVEIGIIFLQMIQIIHKIHNIIHNHSIKCEQVGYHVLVKTHFVSLIISHGTKFCLLSEGQQVRQ